LNDRVGYQKEHNNDQLCSLCARLRRHHGDCLSTGLTEEEELHRPHPTRRRLTGALGVLATAIAVSVLGPSLVSASGAAHAAAGSTAASSTTMATGATTVSDDPNNYTCTGHIQKGAAEAGVTGTEVEYAFSCDGPITGYSIETEPHKIQYFDQAPVVTLAGAASATDSFSCNAFVPGVQINCVGQTSAAFEKIAGQFVIGAKNVCNEPRIDPILTVTDATATLGGTAAAPAAVVTQYLSGPYDLGRPRGCKPDRYGGDTRLGSIPPKIVLPARKK
jgi:hypothetical protein